MRIPSQRTDDVETVRALLRRHLSSGTLPVPELPEIAVRVVESRESANAHQLAEVIKSDRALAMYVLRIAASAPNRAAMPIVSLPHAIAWLGLDEVANMAFTLALQARMLDVPGHHRKARRLWRHSLASALWSRQLALSLGRETGLCYLCGLLHDIGKAVTLRTAHDLAVLSASRLASPEYDDLLEEFHREVAACVVVHWHLPEPIAVVATRWDGASGAASFEGHIVDLARRLADSSTQGAALPTVDAMVVQLRHLGSSREEAERLLGSASGIVAELDRYLAP
jgi:putative nucleotidyltransferase with HDIG domain